MSSGVWRVPHSRNPLFTGRHTFLARLRQELTKRSTAVVIGPSGIGKTGTMVEYAYQYAEEYDSVLYVRGRHVETLLADMAGLAGPLGLAPPELHPGKVDPTVDAVRGLLAATRGWLLIVDGADDPAVLEHLPSNTSNLAGHILVASRAIENPWEEKGFGQPLVLEGLDPEQAAAFLIRRAELNTKSLKPKYLNPKTPEMVEARALAEELDGLPFSLEVAGACAATQGLAPGRYLDVFQEFRDGTPAWGKKSKAEAGAHLVCALAMEQLGQNGQLGRGAANILRLSAFTAPEPLPLECLPEGAGVEELKLAAHTGLLRLDLSTLTFSLHSLAQNGVRRTLKPVEQRKWAEWAVYAVNRAFPFLDAANLAQCSTLLPHALVCAKLIRGWRMDDSWAARLTGQTGLYLYVRGRPHAAALLLEQALTIWEAGLGPDHAQSAQSANNLAMAYLAQGKEQEGQTMLERALAAAETSLGPDHPQAAATLYNLARFHGQRGNPEEAELLLLRALALVDASLGPNHAKSAALCDGLAHLFYLENRHAEAEPHARRVLDIQEATNGTDHPDAAAACHNLALVTAALGKRTLPKGLITRALSTLRQALGPSHPRTLAVERNLAALSMEESVGHGKLAWLPCPWPEHPNVVADAGEVIDLTSPTGL
jgi:tetratricopeptide (TPR) repeat protein